jgi:hypothetical protein
MILLPRATKPDYAITLGRTGVLSRRWNSRPGFSHPPTARGVGLASISWEVESILTEPEPCRSLNARDFSHGYPGTLRQRVM